MTAMPIKAMVRPTSLANQRNGSVDTALLEVVDHRTGYLWLMASHPARGMRALHAAILAQFGVTLSTTGRGRTFEMQYNLFLARHNPVSKAVYDTIPSGQAKRRYWPEAVTEHKLQSAYWALKKGMAAAAVPRTSPHGWWCADDICLPGNVGIGNRPDVLEWLYKFEGQFGFAHSLLSEPWHLQWVMGDAMPARVVAYENSLGKPPPEPEKPPTPPPPTPPVPPSEDDDMHIEIWNIRGCNAKLLATCTKPGVALSCRWSGPGGGGPNEKGDDVIGAHAAAGAIWGDHDLADLRNVFLDGPLPQGDTLHSWTYADFANPE